MNSSFFPFFSLWATPLLSLLRSKKNKVGMYNLLMLIYIRGYFHSTLEDNPAQESLFTSPISPPPRPIVIRNSPLIRYPNPQTLSTLLILLLPMMIPPNSA